MSASLANLVAAALDVGEAQDLKLRDRFAVDEYNAAYWDSARDALAALVIELQRKDRKIADLRARLERTGTEQ